MTYIVCYAQSTGYMYYDVIIKFLLIHNFQASHPVWLPSFYTLSLKSYDGLEDKPHVETDVSNTDSGSLILDVIGGLAFRRLWNCTILAYGCEENSILNGELCRLRNIVPVNMYFLKLTSVLNFDVWGLSLYTQSPLVDNDMQNCTVYWGRESTM